MSAAGGTGGASNSGSSGTGGNGGPGRVRIATESSTCSLAGTVAPALVSGCSFTPASGTQGRAYLSDYPD